MTVTRHPGYWVRCESGDTKPTTGLIANLSQLEENNTGKRYYWNGTTWILPQFQKQKEYKLIKDGSTYRVISKDERRVAQSGTDFQIALQAQLDSMVNGDWFIFYWDTPLFTLNNPVAWPMSDGATTLKRISMKGSPSFHGTGLGGGQYGTQINFSSSFPTGRYAFEALGLDTDASEQFAAMDIDGLHFDNRNHARAKINDGLSVVSLSPAIDAGAIRIRNSGSGSSGNGAINIRNVNSTYMWRTLHLEGLCWFDRVDNIRCEDHSTALADRSIRGDSHIILQSLSVPTASNATPKSILFQNISFSGNGNYDSFLRMRSGNYNTFNHMFPDGAVYDTAVYNLDNTQDQAVETGYQISGNRFNSITALDLIFYSGTEKATLFLKGDRVMDNVFFEAQFPNLPVTTGYAVRYEGGALRNTIENISAYYGQKIQIHDQDAGVDNVILPTGGFQTVASWATQPIVTTHDIVRIIDKRGVAFQGGDELIADHTHWWLKGPPSMLSKRKWGRLAYGTGAATTNVGMLATLTALGTLSMVNDSTNGRHISCLTGAVSGNKAGMRLASGIVLGGWDVKFRVRFKLVDTTNVRLFLGLMTNNEPTGDDPLGAGSVGMMLGLKAADTNFRWFRNNTTGITIDTDTGIAKDTNVHEVKIVVTGGGTTYSVSLDNAAYTNYTTDIPGVSNILAPTMVIETAEAVAKTFQVYDAMIQSEK